MKILILDARNGQEHTDEILDRVEGADIHLTIEMDGRVDVHVAEGVTNEHDWGYIGDPECEYIELPHRDTLSGDKSRARDKLREEKANARDKNAEPAMMKAKRALRPGSFR